MAPKTYDIVIIGGGVSGLGAAYQAAQWGFETAILERNERFAATTSDNSLRIIHGGFRYLQSADLPRVIESIRAKTELLQLFPQLVKPLRCAIPLEAGLTKNRIALGAAGAFYSTLHKIFGASPARYSFLKPADIEKDAPLFASKATRGAFCWEDALIMDPAALTSAVTDKIEDFGGELLPRTSVESVGTIDKPGARLWRVGVKNTHGQNSEIYARVVINASGPGLAEWSERVKGLSAARLANIEWCLAFNVITRKSLSNDLAFGIYGGPSSDRRFYFVVPRAVDGAPGTAIGTGYVPLENGEDLQATASRHVPKFLEEFNAALPGAEIGGADVVHVECGVQPASSIVNGKCTLYGREKLKDYKGYIEILSTKYTTFLMQGRRALNLAALHLGQ